TFGNNQDGSSYEHGDVIYGNGNLILPRNKITTTGVTPALYAYYQYTTNLTTMSGRSNLPLASANSGSPTGTIVWCGTFHNGRFVLARRNTASTATLENYGLCVSADNGITWTSVTPEPGVTNEVPFVF